MTSVMKDKILATLGEARQDYQCSLHLELANQGRVVMGRIRFAIRQAESSDSECEQMREASFRSLDALARLESVDRHFQGVFGNNQDFRSSSGSIIGRPRDASELKGDKG